MHDTGPPQRGMHEVGGREGVQGAPQSEEDVLHLTYSGGFVELTNHTMSYLHEAGGFEFI